MPVLPRFLLLLSFGVALLVADSPRAQGPPPLPPKPTRPSSPQLDGLHTFFSNSRATSPLPAPSAPQSVRIPEQPSPPNQIHQTAFATYSLSSPAMSEELSSEEAPESPLSEDDVYADLHHTVLERSLSQNSTESGGERKEPTGSGWTNTLAMPNFTPMISIISTLLIVIAAFFILAIFLRKVSPQSSRVLPKEAFECLGRYYLTQKHQIQMLRMGSRIVLVSVMPDGVSTLAEITDPDEAVSLLGLCRRLDTNSATDMFRKTIASMSEDELNRPRQRPVVSSQRRGQPTTLDLYSEPDESLAAILARGRQYGR